MVINEGIDNRLFNHIIDSVESTPYYNLLGIRLCKLGTGKAELCVIAGDRHTNPMGIIHGGLIMSLVDAAMGNAVRSLGIKGVTVDISTSFISSAEIGHDIVAEGRVIKAGKNMIFTEAEVWSKGRVLAHSKATFFKIGEIF